MSPVGWKSISIPALILLLTNTERDDIMLGLFLYADCELAIVPDI